MMGTGLRNEIAQRTLNDIGRGDHASGKPFDPLQTDHQTACNRRYWAASAAKGFARPAVRVGIKLTVKTLMTLGRKYASTPNRAQPPGFPFLKSVLTATPGS